jgi:hypothetical protein
VRCGHRRACRRTSRPLHPAARQHSIAAASACSRTRM